MSSSFEATCKQANCGHSLVAKKVQTQKAAPEGNDNQSTNASSMVSSSSSSTPSSVSEVDFRITESLQIINGYTERESYFVGKGNGEKGTPYVAYVSRKSLTTQPLYILTIIKERYYKNDDYLERTEKRAIRRYKRDNF